MPDPTELFDAVQVGAAVLLALQGLIGVLAVIFLVSGLDDLFIDLSFWTRAAYRRWIKRDRIRPLPRDALAARPEQWIAIMVPAWDESAVIGRMLRNLLRTLAYERYRVFVGVYPNDDKTVEAVRAVSAEDARVQCVTVEHPGPTCKADCLNAIYHGIRTYEARASMRFEIFVMQDCEDVIHPLAWRLFNWLIPRKDMVQLPVLSLPRRWWQFTAAHYLDEFAQQHLKDMVVREALHHSVPAAGVGVAFSRRALTGLAAAHYGAPFSVDSLTEDYDLAHRLRELGFKQVFVRFWTHTERLSRNLLTGEMRRVKKPELVCVREYFPASLRAAVRQKARWVVGIALQGWRTWRWRGGLMTRYMLARDRKVLLTSLANVAGYAVVALVLAQWAWVRLDRGAWHFPALVEPGGVLWYLLLVNLVLLGVRIVQRALFTGLMYGPLQAMLSLPRMVWGNLINFLATLRALRLWVIHVRTGRPIGWDKTAHQFPAEAVLASQTRFAPEAVKTSHESRG